jgi:hypothetical protein
MSLIFLDTEFTNFHRPQLLSLGMVSQDGLEFYAELDLACEEAGRALVASSEFVLGPEVLGQWGRVPNRAMSAAQIGEQAGHWLTGQIGRAQSANSNGTNGSSRLTICSDYDTDFKLLVSALRKARTSVSVIDRIGFQNIYPMLGTAQTELAAQQCFESLVKDRGLRPHHALADALALRQAFQAVVQTA